MKPIKKTEYPEVFANYIGLVKGNNPIITLEEQIIGMQQLIGDIPEEMEDFAYAPGKWTIKEVLGHVVDTERIFGYRALRFARNDNVVLPGFDEKKYVSNGNFRKRTLYSLAHEFGLVRESNIALFKSLSDEDFEKKGIANNNEITVKALCYIIAGHWQHHHKIIQQKYLNNQF